MDNKLAISSAMLRTIQQLYAEMSAAQARLEGALRVAAAIHNLPDGSQIDPMTGAITLPDALTPDPSPAGEGKEAE